MTDKITNGLDIIYKDMFAPYKDIDIEFLEVGVAEGGSLLMFKDMLPKASIYGIDIHVPNMMHEKRITLREINQNDFLGLHDFAAAVGRFDIVIDDGSHFTKETRNTFDIFWPFIPKGGLYVIEDWAVCFSDLPYCMINKDKVSGMGNLMFNIASRKELLHISKFDIVVNDKHSYAVYYK